MERAHIPTSIPEQLITPQNDYDNRMELTLNEQGMIRGCNIPCGNLFGYRRGALVWVHLSELMPEFSLIYLVRAGQINPRLRFLSRIGHRFKLISLDGKLINVKFFIRLVEKQGQRYLRVMIFPFCQSCII